MKTFILETLRGQAILDFIEQSILTLDAEWQVLLFVFGGLFAVIGLISVLIMFFKIIRD